MTNQTRTEEEWEQLYERTERFYEELESSLKETFEFPCGVHELLHDNRHVIMTHNDNMLEVYLPVPIYEGSCIEARLVFMLEGESLDDETSRFISMKKQKDALEAKGYCGQYGLGSLCYRDEHTDPEYRLAPIPVSTEDDVRRVINDLESCVEAGKKA